MTKRTRTYNPDKCSNQVKGVIKTKDVTITLYGHHAHEWTIVKTTNGTIIATEYPCRVLARKTFNELKKLYKTK